MKLVAWTCLLLATMGWTVVALVGALGMVGIGGAEASTHPRFWIYALSPWPLIAFTTWTGILLARKS